MTYVPYAPSTVYVSSALGVLPLMVRPAASPWSISLTVKLPEEEEGLSHAPPTAWCRPAAR